ncbi:amidohydrolase [Bradyrhizobium betae]|uniref:Amidohydrolase 3 domain-containing protein n=1 Tax=Bradyrhizobium betae TaxID=244734 RepID=A0A4Q1VRP2_9BRAD|nr:amidohydrolase [Bradyrhizobium betae]RXT54216.1 hypothetical protein B5V03_01860 [Bradyrhizobium betae]
MTTTVYHNANLLTCDQSGNRASAMAVLDGRITAIGNDGTVMAAAGAGAESIDLAGKTIMPGLIDVHNHHAIAGRAILYEVVFPPSLDFDGILAAVRSACETMTGERWAVGGNFGSHHLERIDTLDALRQLDDASSGRPVSLRDDSYHNRWCNTAAMQAAGIDSTTLVPGQGKISTDPSTGRATGLLVEAATALVDAVSEEANYGDPAINQKAAAHAIGVLNSYGVTAFQDAMTFHGMLANLADLDLKGELKAWVVATLPAHAVMYLPGPMGTDLFKVKEQFRTRHVRPDFAKFFLDGVPMTRTSAMLEPYRPSAAFGCCYRGGTTLTLPQFAKMVAECERHGLAVKVHCTGDGSVRLALDGFDIVRDFEGPSDLRHQIAHAVFVDPEDIKRMAALQVTADLSPVLWYPAIFEQAIRAAVPDKLVDRMAPIRDLVEAGVSIAGGSDWPVAPTPDLWDGLEGMVTRRNPSGGYDGQLGPEQAIDVQTAIRAYTLGSAEVMGLDAETGSLEVGKSADFIIIDRDVTKIASNQIAQTKVLSTWFEGAKVYER